MIGSASAPFRLFMSRGCWDSPSLGPRTCFLPGLVSRRLSTPRSGGRVSPPVSWGLLHGAPVLTVAGLSPASSTEWEAESSLTSASSGRDMPEFYQEDKKLAEACRAAVTP